MYLNQTFIHEFATKRIDKYLSTIYLLIIKIRKIKNKIKKKWLKPKVTSIVIKGGANTVGDGYFTSGQLEPYKTNSLFRPHE